MIIGSFAVPSEYRFEPHDFDDNVQERDYISIDNEAVCFSYSPDEVVRDDEGRIVGDDLLSPEFSIASGAYEFKIFYKADADNAYVELYSDSWIAEPVSEMIILKSANREAFSKLYIPFGRSMHDVQMNIHYTGPGNLVVYGITLSEDTSYRWVPVTGYILLFIIIDSLLFIIFSRSAALARSYIRENWHIPSLLAVSFLASLPAFTNYLYLGHDIRFHLARIISISHEISYGQFPVRMLTDMLNGYSYPTSTFYCDIFLYPYALLYYLGLPLHMCWQANVIVLNLVTAWISYGVFKRISGRREIGVIGSAIYSLSAYRMVDIYLRSALGEFTALTFIPLVLLGIWILYFEEEKSSAGWLCLSGGMAAIAMSHLLSLEMISLFLIIFCAIEYKKTFTTYRFFSIIKASLMTILLSLWFILPMIVSVKEIDMRMDENLKYIQMYGAYPSQVFNIFLQGYGFSGTGTANEMPLSLGGGIVAAFALLIYRIMKKDCGERRNQKIALAIIMISLVISMYFFPWDSIASVFEGRLDMISRLVRLVQFPWRYLEITTAVLSLTAVCALRDMEDKGSSSYVFRLWSGIILLGIVISIGSFYVHFVNEAKITRAYSEEYTKDGIAFGEYLPIGAGAISDLPIEAEALNSDVQILSYESIGGERRCSLKNDGRDSSVLIPLFAYPGYHAEDLLSHDDIAFDSGENARINLKIPSGYKGTIRIYYREPKLWNVFEIISLIAFLIYVLLVVKLFNGMGKITTKARRGNEHRHFA